MGNSRRNDLDRTNRNCKGAEGYTNEPPSLAVPIFIVFCSFTVSGSALLQLFNTTFNTNCQQFSSIFLRNGET